MSIVSTGQTPSLTGGGNYDVTDKESEAIPFMEGRDFPQEQVLTIKIYISGNGICTFRIDVLNFHLVYFPRNYLNGA